MWSGSSGSWVGSVGKTAEGHTAEGHRGFVSRFLPKTAQRNERGVDVTELELGDTVRGSVQTQIRAGDFPIGSGGFSQYLPTFEFTGGNITLGMDSRASWRDSAVPTNPGIRVKTTTTRTMEGDHI